MNKRNNSVNTYDVAICAGVSVSTVSHVINKTRFVSEGTRSKVLEAIRDLDYYPNSHAIGLATGCTNMIGVLVSDITNPFLSEIIRSVEKNAVQSGYDIFLCDTNYELSRSSAFGRRFIEQNVDGALIFTTEINNDLIKHLENKKIPIVLLDWGFTNRFVSNIRENFEIGIDQAIKHLIELDHRKFAFIAGPHGLKTADARKEVFINTHNKYLGGLEPIILESDFTISGGWSVMEKMLKTPKRPSAICASNDLMAIGAMCRLKEEGLRIPEDISIIGIDNIPLTMIVDPPLTSINIPRDEVGQIAWKLLMRFINEKEEQGIEEYVDTWLITRSSTDSAKSV